MGMGFCCDIHPVYRLALLFLLSVLLASKVHAQIEDIEDLPPVVLAGVTVTGGFPTGEFGENVTNTGFGLSGNAGYMVPKAPVVIGLELGLLIYGQERRTERFSLTVPDVKVDVTSSNRIMTANAFFRLQKRSGTLRPYLEGVVGFNYLFTSTTIENQGGSSDDDEIATSTNLDDYAFSKGGGAGMLVEVWSGREERTPQNRSVRSVSIDFRVRYQDGAVADYLKKGDVVRKLGTTELNITKSTTDIITAHIGLAIDF